VHYRTRFLHGTRNHDHDVHIGFNVKSIFFTLGCSEENKKFKADLTASSTKPAACKSDSSDSATSSRIQYATLVLSCTVYPSECPLLV
jgi:hypothetical protein